MPTKIVSYLTYLRDISRRIVTNTGFDKILVNTSKQNSFIGFVTDLKYLNNEGLSKAHALLANSNLSMNLFIGLGLIKGNVNGKEIAGPVAYAECELYALYDKNDQFIGEYEFEVLWDTVILNFDLLAQFLSMNILNDDDDNYYDSETMQCMDKISQCEERLIQLKDPSKDSVKEIHMLVFELIKLTPFSNISFSLETDVMFRKTKNLPPCYVECVFTFVARIPDMLSTYESINKFISELNEKSLKPTNTLSMLLESKFSPVYRKKMEAFDTNIEEVLRSGIPSRLSKSQQKAIESAWYNKISYIQGPPGTGKSHTIFHIALTALFLNKKVLIVSQKTPALDIIVNFAEKFFDKQPSALAHFKKYVHGEKNDLRKQIKSEMQSFSDYNHDINKEFDLTHNIFAKSQYIRLIEEKKNASLELEYQSTKSHLKFITSRDKLKREYDVEVCCLDVGLISNRSLEKITKWNKWLKKIELDGNVNYKRKLFISKYNDLVNSICKSPKSLSERDIRELVEISELITETLKFYKTFEECRVSLINADSKHYNAILVSERSKLEKLKFDYFQVKCENNLRANLMLFSETINGLCTLLYFNKKSRIAQQRDLVDFSEVLNVFPIWISEIRHIGNLFPIEEDLFDMVIIDESSQVNLAEIVPVVYRAKRLCIVGDHNQLSLSSTGLTFHLSNAFDQLTWNRHAKTMKMSYTDATDSKMTVLKCSILDFVREGCSIQLPTILLNEHFRSHPSLAQFTSKTFYDNELNIMTESSDRLQYSAFKVHKTTGLRDYTNIHNAEAIHIAQLIESYVLKNSGELFDIAQVYHKTVSIGVVCFLRNQCEYIKDLIFEKIPYNFIDKHEIMIGTAEEFQGNERDIIILSFACSTANSRSKGFIENKNRFNVATSRARLFTYVCFTGLPKIFTLSRKYVKHFVNFHKTEADTFFDDGFISDVSFIVNPYEWTFCDEAYESEFERQVYDYLVKYIKQKKMNDIQIYNQVETCGQKRLDFVLVNFSNMKAIAVEVDGRFHFIQNKHQIVYSYEHTERMEVLKRAGWNIVNTPYYLWYNNGWLADDSNKQFKSEINRIYKELDLGLK